MVKAYPIINLSCAACAAKIEKKIAALPGVNSVRVNILTQKLVLDVQEALLQDIWRQAESIIHSIEPAARLQRGWMGEYDKVLHKLTKGGFRILLALLFLFLGLLLPALQPVKNLMLVFAYAVSGMDVLYFALKGIAKGQVFDEHFLMALATVGALLIGEYAEAVTVMVLYQTGEFFQERAVDKSRRAIAQAMDFRPDTAGLLLPDGSVEETAPESIEAGQMILLKPGERLALDGLVIAGESQLDTAALTGEALPRGVSPGDEVLSGFVNLTGALTIRVTKPYHQSTVHRILEMVENAADKKSRQEAFITRLSAVYTPAVVALALLLAFAPPLFVQGALLSDWVYRALNFLVVSCPCALVISIPLSFFGGIGGASRAGILVKGSNHLEALARADTFVFDKTGTLTHGRFALSRIHPVGISKEALLETAALAEQHASHPIAAAILFAYGKTPQPDRVSGVTEQPGGGVSALVDGQQVLVGNARLMNKHGIALPKEKDPGTISHVAIDGVYAGFLQVSDQVKPCAGHALKRLKSLGVRKLVMLTGDSAAVGEAVARELGMDEALSELLPRQKVEAVEAMLAAPGRRGSLVFAGDGVNDAPVLARADVGFAMGALGSDAAIEAADIVIMNDDPCKMAAALCIARRTVSIARQNAVFAIGVKTLVLLLSALGISSLWMAVFADVGVAVLAIFNAMRALSIPPENRGCLAIPVS